MRVLKIWATSGAAGIGHDFHHVVVGVDGRAMHRTGGQAAEDQGVQQLFHAYAGLGRAADDGDERPAGDRLHDQPADFLVARLGAVEVAGHDVLVDLDDRLDERGVDGAGIDQRPGRVRGHVERAGHAAEIGPLAQRDVEQLARLAEHFLDGLHEGGEVDVVGVHLVDGDEAAHARLARLVEDPPRGDADAALGVDLDDDRIDGMDGADRLADEIGVAGRINGIEPLAAVVEMDDVRLDAMVVDPLFLVEIADARAVVNACRAGDRAGHGEDFVQKGRFSGGAVSGECHVANVLRLRVWPC